MAAHRGGAEGWLGAARPSGSGVPGSGRSGSRRSGSTGAACWIGCGGLASCCTSLTKNQARPSRPQTHRLAIPITTTTSTTISTVFDDLLDSFTLRCLRKRQVVQVPVSTRTEYSGRAGSANHLTFSSPGPQCPVCDPTPLVGVGEADSSFRAGAVVAPSDSPSRQAR